MQRSSFFLLLLLLLGVQLALQAQERIVQHKPFIDERSWHYGFYIGIHDQSLKIQNQAYIEATTGAQWIAENDKQNFGFSVGILGNWRLHKYVDLRLSPGLHFGSKHFTLRNLQNGKREGQEMRSTFIALPMESKITAPRFNNYRPYITMGLHPMLDLTSALGQPIRTKAFQTYASVGMGCDFYLPFFKLNPEIKFLFGLHDVLQRRRDDLTELPLLAPTQSIASARPAMVMLVFNFE